VKIVVFDATLWNPEPLPWTELEALGEVQAVGTVSKDEIGRVAAEAEAVFVWRTVLNREAIRAMPRLRYVGLLDLDGSARVNLEVAAKRGIVVCRVAVSLAESIAEHVFAVLLELARGVGLHMAAVHRREWTRVGRPCWWRFPMRRLAGLTLGLVGDGGAAATIAGRARAFGMRALWTECGGTGPSVVIEGVEPAAPDRVLRESDVIIVLAAAAPETLGWLNRERLAAMKPGAWLIHVGGAGVVDEVALAEALRNGPAPALAALDRMTLEPPPPDHPLLSLRNCRITPHLAWAAAETRAAIIAAAADNLRAWMEGRAEGVLTTQSGVRPRSLEER